MLDVLSEKPRTRSAEPAASSEALQLLTGALRDGEFGRIALVSSFGAESAVLLHLVARVDPSTPVIFLQTGKLFAETLAYRDQLTALLGLRDVRNIEPAAKQLAQHDPRGDLWSVDPDLCCAVRKTMPLDDALDGFDGWITGRKRVQGGLRAGLLPVETGPDGRHVLNPLHDWSQDALDSYFAAHDLPRHPLEAQGYLSIGCATCTRRTKPGEDRRSGRWVGIAKTECGIHLPRADAGSI